MALPMLAKLAKQYLVEKAERIIISTDTPAFSLQSAG
jgi:hypothetical protein